MKKVLKSENVFKIFGNIPDVKHFLKIVGAISDFLHMYCMQDMSSMRGGNAGWTTHHFSGESFKLKMAHKSLQVGDMACEDIKTFYKTLEMGVTFWGTFSDSHRWGNVIFFGLFWGKQQRNRGAFGK